MNRRGYALYLAIVLIGLSSVVFVATLSYLKTDIARTGNEATQAQLRQLLIAGQSATMEELTRNGTINDHALTLPKELSDATVDIKRGKLTNDRVEATVSAAMRNKKLAQTLVYTRQNNKWSLESANLP